MLEPRWRFVARFVPESVLRPALLDMEAGRFEELPQAFDALGPLANSAMPQLRELRETHSDPDIRWMAALNLAILSTNEIPKVVSVLADTDNRHWDDTYVAFRDLPSLRANAFSAIPHFVNALGNYDLVFRHGRNPPVYAHIALDSLAEVPRLRPIIHIALTNSLDSSNPHVRAIAAEIIGKIATYHQDHE